MSSEGTSAQALPIDFAELCLALEAEVDARELRWVFDRDTGNVILLSREYEPAENDGLTPEDIAAAPSRFVLVPSGAVSVVDDMWAFVAQLNDARLKESLELALSAPRPERRFRAVLGWLPEELDRWHAFRQQRVEQRAKAWLATLQVSAAP